MEVPSAFVFYLAVFRLGIVFTGLASIYFGYRLFLRGAAPQGKSGGGEEGRLEARFGSSAFSLRSAAPGTFFALFGAAIVAVNFWQGGPELTLRTLGRAAEIGGRAGALRELTMKGGAGASAEAWTERGKQRERERRPEEAAAAYRRALEGAAEPLNNLAALYLEQGRGREESLAYAGAAARLRPGEAAFLHTYAQALKASGRNAEALEVMGKAARLDPRYEVDLTVLRDGAKGGSPERAESGAR